MEDLHAHAQPLAETFCPDRADHELLKINRGIRVCAAVDDIHHRDRQTFRIDAADVTVKRQVDAFRAGMERRHGNRENRIGAEFLFIRSPVKFEHRTVKCGLIQHIHADQCFGDFPVDMSDRLKNSFSPVALLVAVTQFQRLVHPCGCAGRHGCAPRHAAFQRNFRLYGRIAS